MLALLFQGVYQEGNRATWAHRQVPARKRPVALEHRRSRVLRVLDSLARAA